MKKSHEKLPVSVGKNIWLWISAVVSVVLFIRLAVTLLNLTFNFAETPIGQKLAKGDTFTLLSKVFSFKNIIIQIAILAIITTLFIVSRRSKKKFSKENNKDNPDEFNNQKKHPVWWRHIAPVIVLFFLAPLFGEYLLGNLKFSELMHLPFLALLYGTGAILIREVTRKAGRGYATMLILGVAYAFIEEGLVDQMLFNPAYFTGQEKLTNTVIPFLGMDAWLTLIVVAMHSIWSTCLPIILVEAIFYKRGIKPWLGSSGLAITAVIFVLGAAWLTYEIYLESDFLASTTQLVGTGIVVVAIIAATFILKPPLVLLPGFVPKPWFLGGVAFVVSSLYMLTEYLPGWTKVGTCLLISSLFFTLLFRWSHRSPWSKLHTLALAGGGIVTYAWLGAVMEPETGQKTIIDHIGTIVFIGGAVWLFTAAAKNYKNLSES